MKKIISLIALVLLISCEVLDMYDGENLYMLDGYVSSYIIPEGQTRTRFATEYEITYRYWEDITLVKSIRLYTESGHYDDWYVETIIY